MSDYAPKGKICPLHITLHNPEKGRTDVVFRRAEAIMRFMLRRNIRELDLPNAKGEMLEWLKRHAWKACKLQKGFRGSNPRLSAKILLQAVEVSLLTSPSLRKG